jgi:hypothetical protein
VRSGLFQRQSMQYSAGLSCKRGLHTCFYLSFIGFDSTVLYCCCIVNDNLDLLPIDFLYELQVASVAAVYIIFNYAFYLTLMSCKTEGRTYGI